MKFSKSKVVKTKQPTMEQVDEALRVVAFYSLKNKTKSTTQDGVECETHRIERCVEYMYVQEDHNMQYLEFASNFLTKNSKELVFGNKFDGDYLDGIPDASEESVDAVEYSVLSRNHNFL